MALVNAMESIVKGCFEEFQKSYPLKCDCAQCKEDILALALNHLPSKYVSSHIGEVHIKTMYLDQQLHMDVMRELTQAATIVERNPRHGLTV